MDRNRLVEDNLDIVDHAIYHLVAHGRLRYTEDYDDLRQEMRVALLYCAQRWDPARGLFRTYAWRRVCGAAFDYLRAQPGGGRQYMNKKGEMVDSPRRAIRWSSLEERAHNRDDQPDADIALAIDGHAHEHAVLKELLVQARRRFDERRYEILVRRLLGFTNAEIAAHFRVSETRISQILKNMRKDFAA